MFNHLSLKNKFRYVVQGRAKALGHELLDEMNYFKRDGVTRRVRDVDKIINLINTGASLSVRFKNGATAFSREADGSSNERHLEVLEALLKRGAELDYTYTSKERLLRDAVKRDKGNERMLLLLKYGADVNTQNKFGETPVLIAACRRDIACLKILMENGANVFIKERKGFTPLKAAENFKRKDVVSYLKEVEKQQRGAYKKSILDDIDNGTKTAIPRKRFGGFKNQGGMK